MTTGQGTHSGGWSVGAKSSSIFFAVTNAGNAACPQARRGNGRSVASGAIKVSKPSARAPSFLRCEARRMSV